MPIIRKFIKPVCMRSVCGEAEERRATWNELFFDLIFMVAIAAMALNLSNHLSWLGLEQFLILFSILWWAWVEATFYADRFDNDDSFHRIINILQMLCIAFIAAYIPMAFGQHATLFILFYVAFRLLIIGLYLRVIFYIQNTRTVFTKLIIFFLIAVSLWLISIFVIPPWRYLFWIVALLIDIGMPLLLRERLAGSQAELSHSHLPERFGLFTILVLGELIAGIVYGIQTNGLGGLAIVGAGLGLLLGFAMWWLYFENNDPDTMQHSYKAILGWEYSHWPLVIALTAMSVGIHHTISAIGHHLPSSDRWLLCSATAVAFIMLGIQHLIYYWHSPDTRCLRQICIRFGCSIISISLGFCAGTFAAIYLLLILSLLGIGQIVADIF